MIFTWTRNRAKGELNTLFPEKMPPSALTKWRVVAFVGMSVVVRKSVLLDIFTTALKIENFKICKNFFHHYIKISIGKSESSKSKGNQFLGIDISTLIKKKTIWLNFWWIS